MKIILGLDADRGAWPPTTNATAAQAGGAVVGPQGLLAIVETALGMRGPAQPQAVRLARWRAKLAVADAPGRFWHESFGVDPFATARLVLGMRDALVEAGWHPDAIQAPPPRLADLAAAETSGPALPPGAPDRLRAVLRDLAAALPPEPLIETVTLLDERVFLPPGLGELVSALEASGTHVIQAAAPTARALGDLGRVQARLSGSGAEPLGGDGSFTMLRADTEGAAAEVLADWLVGEADRDRLIVIAARPTALLDAALRRRHLPRFGVTSSSPLRGLIQVLSLSLSTRWKPFDAVRMLELLQMRHSPLPWEVRSRLVRILPGCPGRGGPEWTVAIEEGLAARATRLRSEDPDGAAARIRAGEAAVRAWLQAPLIDPEAGMPLAELASLCSAIAQWATGMASRGVPLAQALAGYASALLMSVQEAGMERIPRLGLERLLDTVLADGEADPTAPREAAAWACVESPGAAWGSARTVVWWGFDPPRIPSRLPWNQAEIDALAAAECTPWIPEAALSAASAGWRRPQLGATERVLLVSVPGPDGDLHPLAHELTNLVERSRTCRPVAEELVASAEATLAGRKLPRIPVLAVALPEAHPTWTIPRGLPLHRDRHSSTSIESLLGCPFGWVLSGDAGIRPGRRSEIAEGEQLIGLLAHRLAAELFFPGSPGQPAAVRAASAARLVTLVEEAAAPLLQPGAAAERARMAERLPIAMEKIAALLAAAGFTVVGTEASRNTTDMPEAGECFGGSIDMLLEDAAGNPALLDLKWTRKASKYRDLLKDGMAIQLAAYSRLVSAGERAAYFLLRDGEAFGTPGSGLGVAVGGSPPTLEDTWARVVAWRRLRLGALRNGTLHALGVDFDPKKPAPDPDGIPARLLPPCTFCEFGRLCGTEAVV
jgi:hypothetical protein